MSEEGEKKKKTSVKGKTALIRQKKVFKRVIGGETIVAAMTAEGYSKSSARKARVTGTKTWQQLMEKHISDQKLLRVLDEGLDATKVVEMGSVDSESGELETTVPDYLVRHKYLETGLKLRAKFPQGQSGPVVAVQVNVNEDREKFK